MNLQIRARLAALCVAVAAVGCGGDDPVSVVQSGCLQPQLGDFTGNATGTAAGALSGCAYYSVIRDSDTQEQGFAVTLTHQTTSGASPSVNLFREIGGRPAIGTYSVGSSSDSNIIGFVFVSPDRNFLTSSGIVTITASSSTGVSGSLSIMATDPGTTNTISVTGNFTSKCVQFPPGGSAASSC